MMRSKNLMIFLLLFVSLLCVLAQGEARAAYKSLQRDGNANTSGAAKVLVAPSRNDYALLIKRIRITNSASSTSPSYRFFGKNSSDKEGDTTSLAVCSVPGCIEILASEAVKEGTPYDYDGLSIRLMPGDRLYFYATADISSESEYVTIEVWYEEFPEMGFERGRSRRSR